MAREQPLLEAGELYFFYRPKVHVDRVRHLDEVERFYLVMAPQQPRLFRLLIIGQKHLPRIIPGVMSPAERDWAIVDAVTEDGGELTREKLSWEETVAKRTIHPARPCGAATYQLICHNGDHSELAYVLDAPAQPGPVQEVFHILPEASYIVKVKNPAHLREGFPGAGEVPDYPAALRALFDQSWINVMDTRLLNYPNTQLLLIGAHNAHLEETLGITFQRQSATRVVETLYRTLQLNAHDHPRKPLLEGEWPEEGKEAA